MGGVEIKKNMFVQIFSLTKANHTGLKDSE